MIETCSGLVAKENWFVYAHCFFVLPFLAEKCQKIKDTSVLASKAKSILEVLIIYHFFKKTSVAMMPVTKKFERGQDPSASSTLGRFQQLLLQAAADIVSLHNLEGCPFRQTMVSFQALN